MIVPAPGQILVELTESDEKTSSGVYVSGVTEQPTEAKVILIGKAKVTEEGTTVNPPSFQITNADITREHFLLPGDTILFRKHTQQEILDYGNESKKAFIAFENVLAYIEKEKE